MNAIFALSPKKEYNPLTIDEKEKRMQIFEFQFNPKNKNRRVETLSHEPNNGGGNLYLVGEIREIMPGNEKLIGKIMKIMKDEYSSRPPADAFRKSLVKVNEFLAAEVAKNNVSWLGNLHLGAISVFGKKVEIAKIGRISVFLISNNKIENLDDKAKEKESTNSFRAKAFGKLISGRIGADERMTILTEEPLNVFLKSGLLKRISEFPFLEKKDIEGFIDEQKKDLSKISGAFLLIDTRDAPKKKKAFLSENDVDFSIKEVLVPVKKIIKNIFSEKKIKEKRKLFAKFPKIKMKDEYKKGLMLIILMAILLISGFLIFRESERKRIEGLTIRMEEMKEILSKTDNLISSGEERRAFSSLVNIYIEISDIGHPIFDEMKIEVASRLEAISAVQRIKPANPILKFEIEDFVPQRILATEDKAFFYSPFSERVVELDLLTVEKSYYSLPGKPNSAAILEGKPIFFLEPDNIFSIKDGKTVKLGRLMLPRPEADLGVLLTFADNLYLRDSISGLIIMYESVSAEPKEWLITETEKPANIRAMSADGSIWLLNFENKISKYHLGKHVKDISLEIFPFVKNLSRISTSSANPHLFLLEPAENRVIIIDKQGRPIRQIISERFDNLIDFWVSDDGSDLFLLNGLEVYRISI